MTAPELVGDGVRFETAFGSVVADASGAAGDVAICSHAHGDHLPGGGERRAVCSELTARLAGVRDGASLEVDSHPDVDLLPSGHVAGSRAALIDDGDRRICFTGDVCTRDRFYLEGFDPPSADVLVVEATYGTPEYSLPPHEEVERAAIEWLNETLDRPVVCYGYALGRAQKLQRLLALSDRDRCLVTPDVAAINAPIAEELGVDFGATTVEDEPDLGPGDALVVPSKRAAPFDLESLVERTGAMEAGFSGWAVDRSYRFRRGLDFAVPLSDHCDFEELLELVAAVDPERVYTHHGFADEFAGALSLRGYDARSLERSQSTLSEF